MGPGDGRDEKYRILKELFGHDGFREGQEELIDGLLGGRDVLGVMPTGAGKSVCYQIPAVMLDGITVVVSPLISLMKDQVGALIQSGVRAAYLNTSLTQEQFSQALRNARAGMYKIIYVAPERLCTPGFLSLSRYVSVSLLAVDEAHCVSQWGQDFRPSYLKISEYLDSLPYRPVVGAFTATATAQVKGDIVRLLGLRDPLTLTTGFDRKNLYFGVIHSADKYRDAKRIVDENRGSSGIIYCATRKTVEEVCERLRADGVSCTRYHAGLSDAERRQNQDDFICDRAEVIAATNAFGMGIDKSNVSYVIHYNMPKNIENYYQEAGRAGRDGSDAQCILLYRGDDVRMARYLIDHGHNPDLTEEEAEEVRQRDIRKLRVMAEYCMTGRCLREYILSYFGDRSPCTCGNCSNCTGETEVTDVTLEAQKILSCVYRLQRRNMRFGSGVIAQILKGGNGEKIKKYDLDTLSTYGIMKDSPEVRIRMITRHLCAAGYLAEGDYHTLTLTNRAAGVLMKGEQVSMRIAPAGREREPRETRRRSDKNTAYAIDRELFDRLRRVRKRLADEIRKPAYIIVSDAVLRDMCVKLPRTLEEMGEVSGMGKVKTRAYGDIFGEEIRKYLREKPDRPSPRIVEELGDGGDLTEFVSRQRERLTATDEELSLTGVCDGFMYQLGIQADRKELKEAILGWLLGENYLSKAKEDGKLTYHTTILSSEAGIAEVERIGQGGTAYKTIVYPRAAQEFIIGSLEEIAARGKR